METPEEMQKERHCFPARDMLNGDECCRVQERSPRRSRDWKAILPHAPCRRVYDEMVFLPLKTFFILVVVAMAALLAIWRDRIDQHYRD